MVPGESTPLRYRSVDWMQRCLRRTSYSNYCRALSQIDEPPGRYDGLGSAQCRVDSTDQVWNGATGEDPSHNRSAIPAPTPDAGVAQLTGPNS